jgi:ribosomal protein L37AE/L43A
MAKVKVTADEFIKNNGLFKVLEHSDGELNKSYRTISQEYIMECTKCGQQVQQRGKAPFECKRCRRSVSPILNAQGKNSWVIDESKINNKNALDAMKIPAKKFWKPKDGEIEPEKVEPEAEEADEGDEDENVVQDFITAQEFIDGNGLFKVLKHTGNPNLSYKNEKHKYILECKCGQQVEKRGSAKLMKCTRCQRSVVGEIEDNGIVWKIDESKLKDPKVVKALEKEPKIVVKDDEEAEEAEEAKDVQPRRPLPPTSEMVDFLKTTSKSISALPKTRSKKTKKTFAEEDPDYKPVEEDISVEPSESIVPAAKIDPPVREPVNPCETKVEAVMMKVVMLKPGQTFHHQESNTLFIVSCE